MLTPFFLEFLAFQNHLVESVLGDVNVWLGCLLGPFVEGVKDVNPFAEFGDIKNTVFKASMDANFICAQTNGFHGLPIGWLQPVLDQV